MEKAVLCVHVFLTLIIVVLLFTLNLQGFHGLSVGDKTDLGQTTTSSFIVYSDGAYYYSANSVTGEVLYQDENCSAVVANLVSLCRENGSITFKAGIYPCNFTINKKLCLSGEGRASTVIYGTITLDSTTLKGTPRSHHTLIQNLCLDGQNRLKTGIEYESLFPTVPLITIQNVDIENYADYGILFTNASDCLFSNLVIGNCATAIYYTTNHNFGRVINCELLNYRVQGLYTDAQIYLSGTVFSAMQVPFTAADLVLDNAFGTITGCWFENNNTAPCINMPNTCYRPLIIAGCFLANRGGDIVVMRNAFSVSMSENFFSQQTKAQSGYCVHVVQGTLYWNGNQLDPAFSATLNDFEIEEGASVKIT
jgi:hypothetical protein